MGGNVVRFARRTEASAAGSPAAEAGSAFGWVVIGPGSFISWHARTETEARAHAEIRARHTGTPHRVAQVVASYRTAEDGRVVRRGAA